MRMSSLTVQQVIDEVTRLSRLDSGDYAQNPELFREHFNKRRAQRNRAIALVRQYVPYTSIVYAPCGQSPDGKLVIGLGETVLFRPNRVAAIEVWQAFADYLQSTVTWEG